MRKDISKTQHLEKGHACVHSMLMLQEKMPLQQGDLEVGIMDFVLIFLIFLFFLLFLVI